MFEQIKLLVLSEGNRAMSYSNKTQSPFHKAVLEFQTQLIQDELMYNRGNVLKTSRTLGISRGTLYKILKQAQSTQE